MSYSFTYLRKHIPLHLKATGADVICVSSPVLCGLQPHVAAVLGVEAGQEQVAVSQGRGGGQLPLCPGAGRVGLQGGAETHPHGVGGPVGPGGGRGGGRGEAASSDQNQLVPGTLPPHGLGGVETTAEETLCGGDERDYI